jgi:hypothetical protein
VITEIIVSITYLQEERSHKKGSPMHVARTCARSREGSDHVVPNTYVCNIFLHFCKRLFPGFEPMTSWS